MALNGCLRCSRCCAFALNFVVWVSGMFLAIVGIWLRMDRHIGYVVSSAFADDVTLYHVTCYVLIGCGTVVTFVGFLGCCGAFQESRCMIAGFFAVLFLLLTVEILISVWAFLYKDKMMAGVPANMAGHIRDNYGRHRLTSEPIDYVQRSMKCCGGVDVYDWSTSDWSNRTTVASRHRDHHFIVPSSCCVDRTTADSITTLSSEPFIRGSIRVGQYLEPLCLDKPTVVVSRGCGAELLNWLNIRLLAVAAVALSVLGFQFISLFASLILCCGMRHESAGGYKT